MTPQLMANRPDGPIDVPGPVREFAPRAALDAVWQNELGGVTFFDADGERYLKWNPRGPVDLADERARLLWAGPRHPVPHVLDFIADERGQLLVTRALPGTGAVTDEWRARPREAVRAIAEGLRALHEVSPSDCPFVCDWARHSEIPDADLVVVQGDACAPNTVIGPNAQFVGHVDLGALGVADRFADLAVASMSLDWNFGPGWHDEFFAAYGIEQDEHRIRLYRALWDAAP